jgi:hypothetical protein
MTVISSATPATLVGDVAHHTLVGSIQRMHRLSTLPGKAPVPGLRRIQFFWAHENA